LRKGGLSGEEDGRVVILYHLERGIKQFPYRTSGEGSGGRRGYLGKESKKTKISGARMERITKKVGGRVHKSMGKQRNEEMTRDGKRNRGGIPPKGAWRSGFVETWAIRGVCIVEKGAERKREREENVERGSVLKQNYVLRNVLGVKFQLRGGMSAIIRRRGLQCAKVRKNQGKNGH